MTSAPPVKKSTIKTISTIMAIIASGLCWYFANNLSGNYLYLLWIAPTPVLIISAKTSSQATFLVSFTAYLTGRLSWFSYLVTVATLVPAIIFTIALPLIFAGILLLTRSVILQAKNWYAVFAFPVFFTAFEFLLISFSPDGTAGSIAYSQSNFLPLIQIASITGILGITFVVSLFSSSIAMGWHYRHTKRKQVISLMVCLGLISIVLTFGAIRIKHRPEESFITVGLAVLDENTHTMDNHIDFQKELLHTKNYTAEIIKLAKLGASLVVLPERALNINSENDSASLAMLSATAKQYHVTVITGYTNFKNKILHNSALVVDTGGRLLSDYHKMHLVNGLESQFKPGLAIGSFTFNNIRSGVAICKDLDYPNDIRKYALANNAPLYIPAWDFVTDDWMHSRMAVLRGVENGFSEVRTARLGRLTISNCYGEMIAETSCANGFANSLTGKVSTQIINTVYTRFGNWFGFIISALAILFLLLAWKKPPKLNAVSAS